jgi:anti-anti-sigma factor
METDFYEENGYMVVRASGKLDTINAPQFTKKLQEALEKKLSLSLVDLSGVSFLSSSGLQALLMGAKISKANGTDFVVFGMQELVKEVFEMSGFNNFIKDFTSKEEALSML